MYSSQCPEKCEESESVVLSFFYLPLHQSIDLLGFEQGFVDRELLGRAFVEHAHHLMGQDDVTMLGACPETQVEHCSHSSGSFFSLYS
jgi:hypothetical protein